MAQTGAKPGAWRRSFPPSLLLRPGVTTSDNNRHGGWEAVHVSGENSPGTGCRRTGRVRFGGQPVQAVGGAAAGPLRWPARAGVGRRIRSPAFGLSYRNPPAVYEPGEVSEPGAGRGSPRRGRCRQTVPWPRGAAASRPAACGPHCPAITPSAVPAPRVPSPAHRVRRHVPAVVVSSGNSRRPAHIRERDPLPHPVLPGFGREDRLTGCLHPPAGPPGTRPASRRARGAGHRRGSAGPRAVRRDPVRNRTGRPGADRSPGESSTEPSGQPAT